MCSQIFVSINWKYHLWTGHKNWCSQLRLNKLFLLRDNKQLSVTAGFMVIRAGQVGKNNVTKDKHIWDQTSGTCAHLIWALVQTLSEWCWSQRREGPPEEVTVAEVRRMHCWRCETCFVMTGCLGCLCTSVKCELSDQPRCRHSHWSSSSHSDTCTVGKRRNSAWIYFSSNVLSLSNETMRRKKTYKMCFQIQYIHTNVVSVCR